MTLVCVYEGVEIYFHVASYSAPAIREYGYVYETQVKAAIRRHLKKSAAPAHRRGFVACSGCVRRGVAKPESVRNGYQCSTCANIEEGAY